jgi:hypothetical protein
MGTRKDTVTLFNAIFMVLLLAPAIKCHLGHNLMPNGSGSQANTSKPLLGGLFASMAARQERAARIC